MKPRVLTKCVANHYAAPNERIIEYSAGNGVGGLIAFRLEPDGRLRVDLYRHDDDVHIVVGNPQESPGLTRAVSK